MTVAVTREEAVKRLSAAMHVPEQYFTGDLVLTEDGRHMTVTLTDEAPIPIDDTAYAISCETGEVVAGSVFFGIVTWDDDDLEDGQLA